MKPVATLLIRNAEQVVTARTGSEDPQYGWYPLEVLEKGTVACGGEVVLAVGSADEVLEQVDLAPNAAVIDAVGHVITPGLVDCHTHLVFAGSRLDEFEMRLQGRSYEEIARAGGGIRSTVRAVRQASDEELLSAGLARLDVFLSFGVTTVEAKSGYGLTTEDELRLLRVIAELDRRHAVDVVGTFLGAHEIPDEYRDRRQQYVDLVVHEMIPAVVSENLARFCDVFCESHVFTAEEARRILSSAREHGLVPKIHAEQLTRSGGARVAAEVEAASADHLDWCEREDLEALASARVVPVLLPGAVFFLGKDRYAPGRQMVDLGMPVAVSTDFNPGSSPLLSLPMAASLACLRQGLAPAEALVSITLNAAWALREEGRIGTLEPAKKADIAVWPVADYREIVYYLGVVRPRWVIKGGRVVWQSAGHERVRPSTFGAATARDLE